MAALTSASVTYTQVKKSIGESGYREFVMKLQYGDGALTYPSGGVPLLAGSLGCPNQIISFSFIDASVGDGYDYKYDYANNAIRIYNSTASHTHSLFLNQADVVDGAGTRVNAATNLIGANSGADISIAGVADTTGHGGIVNVAGSAGAEVATSLAPAATTLYVKVVGW